MFFRFCTRQYLPKVNAKSVINKKNLMDFKGCIQEVASDGELIEEDLKIAPIHFRAKLCYTYAQPGMCRGEWVSGWVGEWVRW